MNLEHIPKFFWFSVSISLFLIAATFSWAAFNSKGMTIEIANAKIAITSQLSEIDKVNTELQILAKEISKIKSKLERKLLSLKNNTKPSNKFNAKEWNAIFENVNDTSEIKSLSNEKFIMRGNKISNIRNAIIDEGTLAN